MNERIPRNPHPVKPPPNLLAPMSDINPNRMIPMHVADQAVAACDKEIAQLRAEVQRLRHRAEALREAGDELWFCLRHGKLLTHAEVQEAVEDWQDARGDR